MSAIDKVLEANRRYAQRFGHAGLSGSPTRLRLAVVACMDARIDVSRALGLEPGDAHVIRNAGAVVTEDVLRSLIVSCELAGTREVMIVNHTRCAMLGLEQEALAARLRDRTGQAPAWPGRFYAFDDLEENVRRQIMAARSHPWLPADLLLRGFIYDVDTGLLREVAPR